MRTEDFPGKNQETKIAHFVPWSLLLFVHGCGGAITGGSIDKSAGPSVAPSVVGLSDDGVPKASKTWSWACDRPPCTYRYLVDNVHGSAPAGAYGGVTSLTRNSGTGTFYLHVQARNQSGLESPVVEVSAELWQVVLLTGLRSHYSLDEASGNRADSSGDGFDLASVSGWGGDISSSVGMIGSAAAFDGTGQTLTRVYGDTAFDFGTDMTFQMWYRATALYGGNFGTIFELPYRLNFGHVRSDGWSAGLSFSAIGTYGNIRSWEASTPVWIPALHVWYHVVGYVDGRRGKIGLRVDDGDPMETTFDGAVASAQFPFPMQLGFCGSTSNCHPMIGNIDEFAFWNRKLTDDEIAALYSGGLGKEFSSW